MCCCCCCRRRRRRRRRRGGCVKINLDPFGQWVIVSEVWHVVSCISSGIRFNLKWSFNCCMCLVVCSVRVIYSCLVLLFRSPLWSVLPFLWPPYVIGHAVIFLPCGFFLHLSSSIFFSSPNLSVHRLDVYHTSRWCGPSANLECRSEMCCMRLAGNRTQKVAFLTPSHNFVGLYLRN